MSSRRRALSGPEGEDPSGLAGLPGIPEGPGEGVVRFPVERTSAPVERPMAVGDFVRDGLLVPAVRTNPVLASPRSTSSALREVIVGGADVLAEIREASSATNTRRSYGYHVLAFEAWCERMGVCALPADPETVEAHLVSFVTGTLDGSEPDRDGEGNLVAAVTMGSVEIRLAAINKLHEYAGFTKPGSDLLLVDFMRGARRYFGTRAWGAKEAIDHDGLRAMVAATQSKRYSAVKGDLIVVLRAAGLTNGQIARLSWEDVSVEEDRVTFVVPGDGRGGRGRTVRLRARSGEKDMCPVALMRALRVSYPGRVLGSLFVSGKAEQRTMTRQAVMALCNRVAAGVGGYAGLPDASEESVRAVLSKDSAVRSGRALRDEAVLTAGWYMAARRGNLSDLQWRDLVFSDDAVRVLLRRSKTDQEGKGATLWLREVPGMAEAGLVSPIRALVAWRDWVAGQVGGDPLVCCPLAPVFAQVTKQGSLQRGRDGALKKLSGARINALVQEYAEAAGLEPVTFEGADSRRRSPFGAHSLRAGFVTEAARGGKLPLTRIMEVTQHQSPSMVMRYVREANQRDSNAITDLLGSMMGPISDDTAV